MARYFLDTSALAKGYRREIGSNLLDRMLGGRGAQPIVPRLAIVEMESIFALKLRTAEIDRESALVARRRLDADLGQRRLLVAAVNDEHFRTARQLVTRHGPADALRTLDALQLAVALGLKHGGLVNVFVAADQKLCRVAALEGFAVTNPEQPSAIVV